MVASTKHILTNEYTPLYPIILKLKHIRERRKRWSPWILTSKSSVPNLTWAFAFITYICVCIISILVSHHNVTLKGVSGTARYHSPGQVVGVHLGKSIGLTWCYIARAGQVSLQCLLSAVLRPIVKCRVCNWWFRAAIYAVIRRGLHGIKKLRKTLFVCTWEARNY